MAKHRQNTGKTAAKKQQSGKKATGQGWAGLD